MNTYFALRMVHIVSATVLLGTGSGIAFFMWMAHRTGDKHLIAGVARLVVLADAWFTAPAVIVQFASGWWLADLTGRPLSTGWIALAIGLFVLVGACWLPVVWLQMHARDLARAALAQDTPLPAQYRTTMRWWFALGWPAFAAVIAIVVLMVTKPTFS